ncbi:MAG: hypothetical protein OEQ24_06680 [Gammaproteobacteria bacterium]|nr:hypothetical protein [Gammaproteobacteria bacterium]
MKKLGFGILWFLALSMGILLLGSMIVGAIAATNDPANAAAAGEAAGEAFGKKYGGIIFLLSFVVAVIGSWFGWLPGTKSKNV